MAFLYIHYFYACVSEDIHKNVHGSTICNSKSPQRPLTEKWINLPKGILHSSENMLMNMDES